MTTSDLQTLGTWPMMSVKQDGTVVETHVPVGLRAGSKKFVAYLPPYVGSGGELEFDTAKELIDAYESACEAYAAATVGQTATPVIRLFGKHGPNAAYLISDNLVRLGNTLYSEVEGGNGSMVRFGHVNETHVYITDTPQARAKIAELQASIKVAADILAGLHTAQDPEQYLLNISSDWQAPADPQPAQAVLPFDSDDDL